MTELNNNRPAVERLLVRPNILMTIRYTDRGEPCEAVLEPVPNSTPKPGRSEHAPEGDYIQKQMTRRRIAGPESGILS